MTIATDVNSHDLRHARIKLGGPERPVMIQSEEMHTRLLEYLLARLSSDVSNRNMRTTRYARIDKMVSTWQKLSKEDVERSAKQEATGEAQAIHMNLPIQQTHMDDMVSFFSAVYAPTAGSFYEEPTDGTADSPKKKAIIEYMNGDAKEFKYFKQLCLALRGLFKYNVGGFHVEWIAPPGANDPASGGNHANSIDMYNFLWDPAIDDPADISKKAEWAAESSRESRMNLIKQQQSGLVFGLQGVFDYIESGNGNVASYYKYPPNSAGLALDGAEGINAKRADWSGYGVGMQGDSATALDNTHEVVTMYCWLNPSEFRLQVITTAKIKNEYALFKMKILDAKRIISIEIVANDAENPTPDNPPIIPYFVGYLNQDDMGAAQRSIAELLSPFQSFGSFLLNVHVAGARGAVHGIQLYDPDMIDMSKIPAGSTVARVASKQPGRDVRMGLQTVNGSTDSGNTMDSLARLLALMQQFFPVQALPSQIAGMDRAVQSQVAAVLQGVNRRLHMLVRIIDSDILGPARFEQYMNIVRNGAAETTGLTNREVSNMLGSGLAQLNREAAAQAMQQLLFAIIQNPKAAEQYDVMGIMNYWSTLLNLDTDLTKFQKQAPVAAEGAPPTPGAPPSGVAG